MFHHEKTAVASGGVATVTGIKYEGDKFMVYVKDVTAGTGNVTITVNPGDSDEAQAIAGTNTINLSNPIALVLEGRVNKVIGTGSGSDAFTLCVLS